MRVDRQWTDKYGETQVFPHRHALSLNSTPFVSAALCDWSRKSPHGRPAREDSERGPGSVATASVAVCMSCEALTERCEVARSHRHDEVLQLLEDLQEGSTEPKEYLSNVT